MTQPPATAGTGNGTTGTGTTTGAAAAAVQPVQAQTTQTTPDTDAHNLQILANLQLQILALQQVVMDMQDQMQSPQSSG